MHRVGSGWKFFSPRAFGLIKMPGPWAMGFRASPIFRAETRASPKLQLENSGLKNRAEKVWLIQKLGFIQRNFLIWHMLTHVSKAVRQELDNFYMLVFPFFPKKNLVNISQKLFF